MKVDVLVAEIGSTTTVVNAFKDLDSENPVFWAQGQAPTSVLEGDVRIGLQGAIDDLCRKMNIDSLEYDEMLATSSAAGGLKMTVHGLVYDMTAKAAREAALGAGGIIHDITVGRLRRSDLARIKEINPNLILIAGGVDYGERDTAIYNAEMIRNMELHLDRRLSEKRIFPAISLNKSGTRREDLLMDQEEMEAIWAMRRAMANRDPQDVTSEIIDNLAHTRTNKDFIQVIKKVLMD